MHQRLSEPTEEGVQGMIWRKTGIWAALAAGVLLFSAACGSSDGGGRTGAANQSSPAASGAAQTGAQASTAPVSNLPLQGVSDTEIKIGAHAPLTGPVAGYSVIQKTAKAYFDMINEQGGVNGRKITYLIEDDGYSPPKTVEVTRKLVEQDKVFAMLLGLGTGPHTAVVNYIKEKGVLDIFPSTGHTSWCVPPQATIYCYNLPYNISGKIIGQYVAQNFAGKKAAVIYQNDDFGKDELAAFKEAVQGKAQIVAEEPYEATATNLNAQVLKVKDSGADVVFGATLPPFSASAIKFSRQQGFNPQWIIAETNSDPQTIRLAGADVMEGVMANGYLKIDENDPAVQEHIAFMKKYLPDQQWGGFSLYAYNGAQIVVELLKRAGRNLTRESFIKAAEEMRGYTPALALVPVNMSPQDHLVIEGSRMAQVKNGTWTYIGDYVNFETTK
jgi:ABC-type branched-subunit amino acid transport system substrate-binding protein